MVVKAWNLGLVGLGLTIRELREESHGGPVIAKDEGGVAVVFLDALDLGARKPRPGASEGRVDQLWEGHVGDGSALRPTGRSPIEEPEAVVGVVGPHADAAGVPRVGVVGAIEVSPCVLPRPCRLECLEPPL